MNGTNTSTGGFTFPYNVFNLPDPPPQTPADVVFFSLSVIISAINLAFCLLVFVKYKYSCVKRKRPVLVLISLLFNFLWFLSYSFANGVLMNYVSWACPLVNVWMFNVGLFGFLCVILARLISVWFIFTFGQRVKMPKKLKVRPIILIFVLFAPSLIISIFGSIFPFSVRQTEYTCRYTTAGAFVPSVYTALHIVALLIFSILNCRVRREFNEVKVEIATVCIGFFGVLFIAITWSLRLNLLIPIRIIINEVPIILSTFYFWGVNYKIVFKILICDQKYFENWMKNFHENTQKTLQNKIESARKKKAGAEVSSPPVESQATSTPYHLVSSNTTSPISPAPNAYTSEAPQQSRGSIKQVTMSEVDIVKKLDELEEKLKYVDSSDVQST